MRQPLIIPILHEGRPAYQLVEEFEGIPKGFVFDGASIPRLLWAYKPPDGIHRAPCLHHDWDYQNKGFGPWTRMPWDPARERCDSDLLRRLEAAGLEQWDAHVMWRGVRLGGWVPWSKPKVPPLIMPIRMTAPFQYMSEWLKSEFAEHLYA